jgi:hypothetical protein
MCGSWDRSGDSDALLFASREPVGPLPRAVQHVDLFETAYGDLTVVAGEMARAFVLEVADQLPGAAVRRRRWQWSAGRFAMRYDET